ncbi:putative ribonuclease [Phycisphaera mikurensis NBRC 102666]|uniref:Putative ribonuclease n=1 Tax=Phycisphaera mikurensis (strain NBRC 102666 / KCTC 22515 / FYK2301M01) TaxID=1142394 RepID=I0IBD6_PHYMF|nr:putative ribonuclease [Phycisphaera mikurensis NBRC 102666]
MATNVPGLVTTDGELLDLVATLREAGAFAFDTEFIGEQNFFPIFCLLQVATIQTATLIDPLAGVDLLPLWELIADPAVETLVHAGLQDLEPVERLTGRPPAAIYDTQIAAGFAGLDYPCSLRKLTDALTDADLGADHKFTDWRKRPLTGDKREYAANDVRYLALLRERIDEEVAKRGHTAKVPEENRRLCAPGAFVSDPLSGRLKAQGTRGMSRRTRAVLDALLHWRQAEAIRNDVPVRMFLADQVLVDLALHPPADAAALRGFKGVPRPVKEHYAAEIPAVCKDAADGPLPPRARRNPPPSEEDKARLDAIWPRVRAFAEDAGISPSLLLNKKELTALVYADAAGQPLPPSRLRRGWRSAFLQPILGDLVTPEA